MTLAKTTSSPAGFDPGARWAKKTIQVITKKVEDCFTTAREAKPSLYAYIDVRISVDRGGRVRLVQLSGVPETLDAVRECVNTEVGAVRFRSVGRRYKWVSFSFRTPEDARSKEVDAPDTKKGP